MSKTVLEAEKASKKAAHETKEVLDAIGDENEDKAIKAVQQLGDEGEVKKKKDYDKTLNTFDKLSKGRIKTYEETLAGLLETMMQNYIDWNGYKFKWKTHHSIRGVGLTLKDPSGGEYQRGFKPIGMSQYDLHAIKVLVWQTENTVEEYAQKQEKINRSNNKVGKTTKTG